MDTETGRFVDESEATVYMNRYAKGQLVVITGDVFRVTDVGNHDDRGRLVLVALDKDEREAEAETIRNNLLKGYQISNSGEPRNRAERRKAARAKRRGAKRSNRVKG
jgi:hypothetical protein